MFFGNCEVVLKMKKILLFLILGMFFSISFVSAETSIGSIKQGDSILLTQVCSNCTYVNLTQVIYPNKNFALLGQFSMIKNETNFSSEISDQCPLLYQLKARRIKLFNSVGGSRKNWS